MFNYVCLDIGFPPIIVLPLLLAFLAVPIGIVCVCFYLIPKLADKRNEERAKIERQKKTIEMLEQQKREREKNDNDRR
ncbi:MAG: hypothetical protein K6A81_07470 [Clostridiales bacterium]|nr:hypothetical protein [Clostridiales bacterium]